MVAIVSNANTDATSGGVRVLIIAHGYLDRSKVLAGVANRPIGEKIYHAMGYADGVAFSDVSWPFADYLQYTDTRAGVMVLIRYGYTKEIADALLPQFMARWWWSITLPTRLALNAASEICALQKKKHRTDAEEIVLQPNALGCALARGSALLVTRITGRIGTARLNLKFTEKVS